MFTFLVTIARLTKRKTLIFFRQNIDRYRLKKIIINKLSKNEKVYLNLGCGKHYKEPWINIDYYSTNFTVFACDLTKKFPLFDECSDIVYASHVLEHFDRDEAKHFLAECKRVLKPGGHIRLVLPDLEEICKEYLKNLEDARHGDISAAARYEWITIELLDQLVRNTSGGYMADFWSQEQIECQDYITSRIGTEFINSRSQSKLAKQNMPNKSILDVGQFRLSGEAHLWMYDSYSLSILLNKMGFRNISIQSYSSSEIEGYDNINLDLNSKLCEYKPDSFYIEAICPNE